MRRQQVAIGCEHPEHPERGRLIVQRETDLVVVVREFFQTQPSCVESKLREPIQKWNFEGRKLGIFEIDRRFSQASSKTNFR